MSKFASIVFLFSLLIVFQSCNENDSKNEIDNLPQVIKEEQGVVGLIEGKIFCIPSPYKFAKHIRIAGFPYNHTLLNPANNKNLYESSFKKNINFGIFGIDLAYINIFEQSSDALNYFSALKSLSEKIGLSEIFDVQTLERLENNMVSQDSLLHILSYKYREADELLKTENQKSQAALILAGSWIESLYILTQIEKERPDPLIQEHIAEHMFSSSSLLDLLRPYYRSSDDYKELIDDLVHICYQFDGITYNYSYKKPITYSELRKTVITSESQMKMYPEHLANITKQINALRNNLIN